LAGTPFPDPARSGITKSSGDMHHSTKGDLPFLQRNVITMAPCCESGRLRASVSYNRRCRYSSRQAGHADLDLQERSGVFAQRVRTHLIRSSLRHGAFSRAVPFGAAAIPGLFCGMGMDVPAQLGHDTSNTKTRPEDFPCSAKR
jgi:hypothetical protein